MTEAIIPADSIFAVEYRVDVTDGSPTWAHNALTFASIEAAQEYGTDLYCRWTAARALRVVRADHPDHEPVDLTDPRIFIGG